MKRFLKVLSPRGNPLILHLLTAQVATVIGAFLVNVLSARAMGPEARGEIAFILQLGYLAGSVVSLGRDRSVLSIIEPGSPASNRVYPTLRRLSLEPVVLISIAGGIFGVWEIYANGTPVVALAFWIFLLANLCSRYYRSSAIIVREGRAFQLASSFGQVILVAWGVVLLAQQTSQVAPWMIAYGVSLLVPYMVVALARRRSPTPEADENEIRHARGLGLRILPSSLIDMAMTKSDRMVLPLLGSFGALGYYAVAASVVDFALLPFRQLADANIPRWAAAHQRRQLRIFTAVAPSVIVAAGVVVVVVAGAHVAIPLIFGEEYEPATRLLPWLGIATWCHILAIYVTGVATAIAAPRIMLGANMLGIILAAPSYYILIPQYGAVGAAASIAIGFASASAGGCLQLFLKARSDRKSGL